MAKGFSARIVLGLFVGAASPAWAAVSLVETFDTDPVLGGRAGVVGDAGRFTFDNVNGGLTAAYDSILPTTQMVFPLGGTLTQDDGFNYSATFTIHSAGLSLDSAAGAQIAFGLMNSTTTGTNRDGGADFISGSAFDVMTVDYFPNVTSFGGPTLSPTVIESDYNSMGGLDFYSKLHFTFGSETLLDDAGESSLPLDVPLTATVAYDPATGRVTLSVSQGVNPLTINALGSGGAGGFDTDILTIQTVLAPGSVFSFDSFGLMLWQDSFDELGPENFGGTIGVSTLVADVTFDSFTVTQVPEPASAALLAVGLAGVLIRRR